MVENTFYKGSSSRESLFNLVRRFQKLELEGGIILHMVHVSGKRMIASEVVALSRGDITKGVIQGNNLLTYFPFYLSVDQRSGELVLWINSWWSSNQTLTHLSVDGSFDRMFDEGNYLWTPPPAVTQIAVEQLCRSYHLRKRVFILFVFRS